MTEEFFEPQPPRTGPLEEDEPVHPPWFGPPRNVFGATWPANILLARTDQVAIAVPTIKAYSTGLGIDLMLVRHPKADIQVLDLFEAPFSHRWRESHEDPGFFRFGILLPDGSKVTSTGAQPILDDPSRAPDGPVLGERGGGGSSEEYHREFWLWPLPEEGTMSLVIDWRAAGIPLTSHEIETASLRRAAEAAIELWPEEPPGDGDGSFRTVRLG